MADTRDTDVQIGTPQQSDPWEKSSHPLFIHHSDKPGANLVSQPLMEDNYITWHQSMLMALTIKNKKGFIDGSLTKPNDKPKEALQWERCDVLVKTWLLGSISKDISSSVIHCESARSMWLELKERFSHTQTVSLFHIENAIHDCEQGADSVSVFFNKLKALWDEKEVLCAFPPCTCAAASIIKSFMETQKTMKFLMGLNDSHAQTRSNIVAIDPLPDLNKAFSMVLRQEKQAAMSNTKVPVTVSETAAFSVKREANGHDNRSQESKFCDKCHMTNHNTKQCRAHLKCSFCNGKGHTADYCRKKKRAMEGGQGKSTSHYAGYKAENLPFSQEDCQRMMTLFQSMSAKSNDSQHLMDPMNAGGQPSVNHVGNVSTYEHFSGPAFGGDDWDGN